MIDERHANELLLSGNRDAGLQELRSAADAGRSDTDATPADLARVLINLSYQLRFDNVTGTYHPENFAECEALLDEVEGLLSASPERPDGWTWLAWHTAMRGLLIAQNRRADAVAATDRQLGRIQALEDADAQTIERLRGWCSINLVNA